MAVQLIHLPFPAAAYNALPHIKDCHDSLQYHGAALKELLSIVLKHSPKQEVSVHLIHKHFDLKPNRIMVYETVKSSNHADFILSSPKNPDTCKGLRGLYFKAIEGNLQAYEFTTDEGADISEKKDFLAEFHDTLLRFGVQEVFALTVKIPSVSKLTEIELPFQSSTILLRTRSGLSSQKTTPSSVRTGLLPRK